MTARGVFRKVLLKALPGVLGGLFVFGAVLGRAATTADLTILVGVRDTFPPTPVADLAALATITPGQVLLTWTAPREDIPYPTSGASSSYIIKYATYSADSWGPDPDAWWAAATTAAGPPVPQAPGSPESFVMDLNQGTRYWFAVRSLDDAGNLSPHDVNTATVGQQANALTNVADPLAPAAVAGFTVGRAGGVITLAWPPVTTNVDGTPAADVVSYTVYVATSLFQFEASSASYAVVPEGPSRSVTIATGAVDLFYLVLANDGTNESPIAFSNFLHVTPTDVLGQRARAAGGTVSQAYLPEANLPDLSRATGNVLLRVEPNTTPSLNTDPRARGTYTVGLAAPEGALLPNPAPLTQPALTVLLAYQPLLGETPDPSQMGVLWWNGARWIKLGGEHALDVNTLTNTVAFRTALPGVYQVRRFAPPDRLSLDRANVIPRIFTPNGDGINDVVHFIFENPRLASFDGRVMDGSGADVAALQAPGAGAPSADSLQWDGRDKTGQIVPAGVYIYKIHGDGRTLTGTVVVAK